MRLWRHDRRPLLTLQEDHGPPIVAITGDDVVKVVCRTCNAEHKYRHNKTGKKEMTAEQAFQKVLASVTGQMGEPSAEAAKKKRNRSS